MNKIQELIEWAGTQAELARRLGVERGAVNQWVKAGIPPKRAIQIEQITGGKFKAADLYDWESAA